jgi:SAM-dependent methyltransferase
MKDPKTLQYGAEDSLLYDSYATGLNGDVEFHVSYSLDAAGPVMEMGCGTGRLLIPIAQEGVDIIGVDGEPSMLEIAERKLALANPSGQVQLIKGDLQTYRAEVRCKLILVAYRTFLHLTEPGLMRRSLEMMHTNLDEDGLAIISFFDPSLEFIDEYLGPLESSPVKIVQTFAHPTTGGPVVMSNRRSVDPETQLVVTESIFEEEGGEITTVPLTLRYLFRPEMESLLALCGFEVEALYGDFFRGPYHYGGEQIWVVRKSSLSLGN